MSIPHIIYPEHSPKIFNKGNTHTQVISHLREADSKMIQMQKSPGKEFKAGVTVVLVRGFKK
jgi:hypothetical protein